MRRTQGMQFLPLIVLCIAYGLELVDCCTATAQLQCIPHVYMVHLERSRSRSGTSSYI